MTDLVALKQELQQLDAKRRKLKRAIKAAQPKARKVRDPSERQRAAKYVEFLRDRCDRCWICGRTANDKPAWWHGIFMVERMHVCNKPRVEDVRVIIAACSLCHRIQHGDHFPQTSQEPLTLAELLGVKVDNDPGNFDLEFLQSCSVGRLPEPAPPSATYPRKASR